MTEDGTSSNALLDIVRVLQSIDSKLDSFNTRIVRLESTRSANNHGDHAATNGGDKPGENESEAQPAQKTDRKDTPKICYSDWSTNHLLESLPPDAFNQWDEWQSHSTINEIFDLRLSKAIEARLGDCWHMPDDNRLPLKFFKRNILKSNIPWGTPVPSLFKAKQPFERELDFLCQFDCDLRQTKGNDFLVADFDDANNSRIYRLGEPAVGNELMVSLDEPYAAPWSRVILLQGISTGKKMKASQANQPLPYFTRPERIFGVWDHISSHLLLKPRPTTTNPYANSHWTGFHTVFYEICETTDMAEHELWANGPLYDHPLGWQFRKCAFTLYTPVAPSQIDEKRFCGEKVDYWTTVVLAPSGFFNERNHCFPMERVEADQSQALGHCLGRLTQLGGEMNLIGHGMERISDRWSSFQSYFDFILDRGDSLMQPREHDNLLFDDSAFSRSRRYFWSIDCLTDFDTHISDNLTQWELYKSARLPASLDTLPKLDRQQYDFAERQHHVLENQRQSFRQKLAATNALRDALFNASAVIESRASTRLGENVKLLTFVSIFFLPLSFIASLWSINDTFSTNVLAYVIVIVGVCTYVVMFNINSLAQGFGRFYDRRKKQIIRRMKDDDGIEWRLRAEKFEIFRPKHENPEPSEWYIPLYLARHPQLLFGVGSSKKDSREGFWRGLRRGKKVEVKEVEEEGWVIE